LQLEELNKTISSAEQSENEYRATTKTKLILYLSDASTDIDIGKYLQVI